jgi:hypothetical protein
VVQIACTDTIWRIKGNGIGGESNVHVMMAKPWDSQDNWIVAKLCDVKESFFKVVIDLERCFNVVGNFS